MRKNGAIWLLAAWTAFGVVGEALALSIYWEDGDGGNGTITSAGWNDIQTAINNAQAGSGTRGIVKLEEGLYQRAAADATVGDLRISPSGDLITLSGGWDSSFTSQRWKTIWDATHDTTQETGYYSVLDVNANDPNYYRALDVARGSTWVEGVKVTGGCGRNNQQGVGIWVDNCDNVRISHVEITNNKESTESYWPLRIGSHGAPSHGCIVEYCTIHGNDSGGPPAGVAEGSGFLANCIIRDETPTSGSANGSGFYRGSDETCSLFGCLMFGMGSSRADSGVIHAGHNVAVIDVVNCTIADNGSGSHNGFYGTAGAFSIAFQFRNSVFASNAGDGISVDNTTSGTPHDYSCFMGHSIFYQDGIVNRSGAIPPNEPYYDEGGVQTNTNPQFVGKGRHPYQLLATSPGVDSGYELRDMTAGEKGTYFGGTTARIRYVNMRIVSYSSGFVWDTNYDPKTDVIVDLGGYGATEQDYLNHYIYPYDLAGNRRVRLEGIDIGAYEYQPAKGTVVLFK